MTICLVLLHQFGSFLTNLSIVSATVLQKYNAVLVTACFKSCLSNPIPQLMKLALSFVLIQVLRNAES